ncbi:DUF1491 family protein [Amorphus orientalis]|uniref:DUF1491 domain-containing protein n=1 Tax=Amorphus orientalis TaxID=649198 RepID=A0AAE4ARE9_9HYPH|nr:DUF1491 family protein [Amorphus orientalis]MDQ0315116.1 hypothetical protein [Amorphus orientalis]
MRLTSSVWVSAYLRRCQTEGVFGAVVRKGAAEAGAIFVKINRLDGSADLFAPAPQALEGEGLLAWGSRRFEPLMTAEPEADVDARLARERDFDPDLWVVEIEDRAARTFLDEGPEG